MESMAVMRGKGLENDEDNRFPWTRVQMRIKNKIEFETKAAVGCWMFDVCVQLIFSHHISCKHFRLID